MANSLSIESAVDVLEKWFVDKGPDGREWYASMWSKSWTRLRPALRVVTE